jgi:hypothetical protein
VFDKPIWSSDPSCLSHSLCSLAATMWVAFLCCDLLLWFTVSPQSRNMEPRDNRLNLWSHETKWNFPTLNCFTWLFCHNDETLTNIWRIKVIDTSNLIRCWEPVTKLGSLKPRYLVNTWHENGCHRDSSHESSQLVFILLCGLLAYKTKVGMSDFYKCYCINQGQVIKSQKLSVLSLFLYHVFWVKSCIKYLKERTS